MKIGNRLYLVLFLMLALIVVVGISILWLKKETKRATAKADLARGITVQVDALSSVFYEYSIYHEIRMEHQWRRGYDSITQRLEDGTRVLDTSEQEEILESIRRGLESIQHVFLRLVEMERRRPAADGGRPAGMTAVADPLESRLTSQVLLMWHNAESGALRLMKLTEQELIEAQRIADSVVVAALIIFMGTLTVMILITRSRIVGSVSRLLKGTEIVGSGNLDYRVGIDTKDEVGQLSMAFDRMSENLKKVTTSRDELDKEIVERKQAGEALKESEERHRVLFESSRDAIMILAPPSWNFTSGNPTTIHMFGARDEQDFCSRPPWKYSPEFQPDGRPSVDKAKEMIQTAMRDGSNFFEWMHRRTDGEKFLATVLLSRVEISGQALLQATVRDITESKKAEERIAQETEVTGSLFKISRAIAQTTDISRLMDKVVENVQAIMGSDMTFVYLWDAEMKRFSPSEGTGLGYEMIPIFRSETIDLDVPLIKGAFDRGGPVIARANPGESLHAIQVHGLYAWIKDLDTLVVVPLMGKREYLGLLVCVYRHDNPRSSSGFTERDTGLVRGIGHHVSIALEEARHYKDSIDRTMELSHKIETIRAMHEIDRSILSTVDPQEVLEIAVNMIAKVISFDRCTIALVDKEKDGFTYAAGHGLTYVKIGNLVPFGETSATEIIKTLRPQYISNLTVLKSRLPLEERLLGEGFLSHIRIPLVVRSEAVGVLSVGAKRPAAFTPNDLSTIRKLAAQIGVALNNARLINDMKELLLSTIRTLSEAIDAKSPWTRGHSDRVTAIALDIGGAMGMGPDELKDFEIAGLLHDVGQIGTLEKILDKPGKLDEEELKLLREHPAKGAEILSPIRQLEHILPVIRHHHEFYDGTGYPDGLKAGEIPLQARILAVADTVDAMGSDRPYRKGMDMEKIVAELKRCSGTQFDPGVVEAFFKTLEKKGVSKKNVT